MPENDYHTGNEELEVKVTHVGATSLKRLSGIVRWQVILGLICSVGAYGNHLFSYWLTDPETFKSIKPIYWEYKFEPVFEFLTSAVFIAQLIFYLRFVRRITRAIDRVDTDAANLSFNNLYQASVFAVFGTAFDLLLFLLDLWANLEIMKAKG
jgi:hypothetical protein